MRSTSRKLVPRRGATLRAAHRACRASARIGWCMRAARPRADWLEIKLSGSAGRRRAPVRTLARAPERSTVHSWRAGRSSSPRRSSRSVRRNLEPRTARMTASARTSVETFATALDDGAWSASPTRRAAPTAGAPRARAGLATEAAPATDARGNTTVVRRSASSASLRLTRPAWSGSVTSRRRAPSRRSAVPASTLVIWAGRDPSATCFGATAVPSAERPMSRSGRSQASPPP